MTCRESSLSSALITFARGATGLTDAQMVSLNHALIVEGAGQTADQGQWSDVIDTYQRRWNDGELAVLRGSRNPLPRLEAARGENASGPRLYAAARLIDRARAAAEEHEAYLTELARDTGVTFAEMQRRFDAAYALTDRNSRASREFLATLSGTPRGMRLMTEDRSQAVYEQLAREAAEARAAAPARPAVTRMTVSSSAIQEVGYDPESGRAEVVMRSNPDRVYAYRMTREEWNDFTNAPSIGSYFARNIRANPRYQYETTRGQAADATRSQCPTCGRFRGAETHTCPVPGSPAAVAADVSAAVAAAAGAPVERPAHRVRTGRQTPYRFANIVSRMPGVTAIHQDARIHGRVEVPIYGTATGANYWERENVTGHLVVAYDPRTRAYTVEDDDPNAIDRRLRCSCRDYQMDRDCVHVQAYLNGTRALLARGSASREQRIAAAQAAAQTAAATVQQDADALAVSYASSFQPLSTRHAEDDTVFQAAYEEFREARMEFLDARSRGEDPDLPLPYIRENAFGPLGGENGRQFGIELEAGFPSNWTPAQVSAARAAIGRELYDLGLTRSATQGGYGASHGAYRTEHARGWSFEHDGTTGGSDGQAGFELVSPVMRDTPETWENIEKITEILRRHGAKATTGSGMHVHVGIGDYGTRVDNHNRLLNAFASNEDLIYRLSSEPVRGTHRGMGFCAPNSAAASPFTDLGAVRRSNTGHYIGLNFQSVSGHRGDHVEFRTWDATLRKETIQAHIGLSVMMASAATREGVLSTTPSQGRQPVGTRLAANPNRAPLTGDAWKESTRPVREFLDRFVPGNGGADAENPLFRQIVGLFAFTKPQRRR